MKLLFVGAAFFAMCCCAVGQERASFPDETWGTLVPCHWRDAKGMLCPHDNDQVLVFPSAAQMKLMKGLGLPLPKGFRRKARGKRDAVLTDRAVVDGFFYPGPEGGVEGWGQGNRSKRAVDDCFFGPCQDEAGGEAAGPDYERVLEKLITKQWGNKALLPLDPETEKIITTKISVEGTKKAGVYDMAFGRAEAFKPDTGAVVATLREKLQMKKEDGRPWLDVQKIMVEFKLCYHLDYSQAVDKNFEFKRGVGTTTWYYRVGCWRRKKTILYSIVIYYDSITLPVITEMVTRFRKDRKCRTEKTPAQTTHRRGFWFWKKITVTTASKFTEICNDVISSYKEAVEKPARLTLKMRTEIEKFSRNKMLLEVKEQFALDSKTSPAAS